MKQNKILAFKVIAKFNMLDNIDQENQESIVQIIKLMKWVSDFGLEKSLSACELYLSNKCNDTLRKKLHSTINFIAL